MLSGRTVPLSAKDVREALRVCFDPELPVNVVDLGLLHAVELTHDPDAPGTTPRFQVTVILLRRTSDDEREAMLQGQVANRLAGMYEVSTSRVCFVDEPRWTADRMSDAARAQLGLNRVQKPGLIQIQT